MNGVVRGLDALMNARLGTLNDAHQFMMQTLELKDVPSQCFQNKSTTTITCQQCSRTRDESETMNFLTVYGFNSTLHEPVASAILETLGHFTPEKRNMECEGRCASTGIPHELHCSSFETSEVICVHVAVPTHTCLADIDTTLKLSDDDVYTLTCFVNRLPHHYTAYYKEEDQWICCDDRFVEMVSAESTVQPYLLFYCHNT